MKTSNARPYLIRLSITLVIATVFAFLFNEITYLMLKENTDRAPTTVRLVIPAGTAERVAAGEQPPDLPAEMTFVVGDVLEVQNNDTVDHQLGPIWVPSGATGKLVMGKVDRLAYTCSFQTSKYLGLDITQPTTLGTRMAGLIVSAPTVAALLFVYSLAAWPIKPKPAAGASVSTKG